MRRRRCLAASLCCSRSSPRRPPPRRASARASRCACPSPARGCSRRRAAHRVPARLPEALHRRRARRGAEQPRDRHRLRRRPRQPGQPGITTTGSAVFLGRFVGTHGVATFRPHIGCVPASGGGQRTPTAYHAVQAGHADRRASSRQLDVLPSLTLRLAARCPRRRSAWSARRTRSGSTATRRRRPASRRAST